MRGKCRRLWTLLSVAMMMGASARAQVSEPATLTPLDSRLGSGDETEKLKRTLLDPAGQVQLDELSGGSKLITLFGNGQSIKALSVPTFRLNDLTDALTKRVISESRTDQSALLELRSNFAGRDIVRNIQQVFDASDFSVSLTASSAEISGLNLNEGFALALERARAQGVLINVEQLQMLPATYRLRDLAKSRGVFRDFSLRYTQAIQDLGKAIDQPNDQTRAALVASANATRQSFIDDWPRLRNDPEARRLAVLSLDALSRQSALKAEYGVHSNFEPESYRNIYRESLRAVLLSTAGGERICSGLALDDTWVLTAGHCFSGRAATSVRVQFPDGKGTLGASRKIKQSFPDIAPGSHNSDVIDYVFIRVEPDASAANNDHVDLEAPPVCLLGDALEYEAPVIVIGYAQGAKLVYDHAYIWYPFRLTDDKFAEVEAMTGARLERLAEAFYPNSPNNLENFVQTNLKSFDQAYATKVGSGAAVQREYRSSPLGVKADRPLFGFDTDTQAGNSGGPVYARGRLCVAGVFGGGMPDNVMIAEATWKEHEFATPMTAILADLASQDLSKIADDNDRAAATALMAKLNSLVQ